MYGFSSVFGALLMFSEKNMRYNSLESHDNQINFKPYINSIDSI